MLHVHFDVMLPIARIIRPAQGVLHLRISEGVIEGVPFCSGMSQAPKPYSKKGCPFIIRGFRRSAHERGAVKALRPDSRGFGLFFGMVLVAALVATINA
jgi:hypothetical protein